MISYLQRPFLACLIWNGYTTDRARTAAGKNHCSLLPASSKDTVRCRQALRVSCRPTTTSRLVLPQEAIEAKPRLGRGGDQAARGRRQAGGAVAAASIDLSAAGCAWGWHATRARILPSAAAVACGGNLAERWPNSADDGCEVVAGPVLYVVFLIPASLFGRVRS